MSLKFKKPLTKLIYAFNQYPLVAYNISGTVLDTVDKIHTRYIWF